MRYRPEHKAKTRAKIVAEAGRLFRRRGYDGVGIDRIMSAAKLTHGGFYGHFRSKAELFVAVLRGEHDFIDRLRRRTGRDRATLSEQAVEVVAGYLDPANRTRVGQGCSLAALSVDVGRSEPAAQAAYAATVRELVAEFERGLENPANDDPRALASAALSVGGLLLARGMGEDEMARKLLAACRAETARLLRRPQAS
ncbi:MAG: TetR/AcrR family transcriptional regulator [Alphaproteobacteria bacterium]